jgi:phytoene dehydrogenase-like protein
MEGVMDYDVIVVGGGIAGLTAAAYLSKAGRRTLLLEKQSHCGGLVGSFEREGFLFDGGIRAMEDSGVLFPMLRQLGLEIEFVKNHYSLGLGDTIIRLESEDDLEAYQAMLTRAFPAEAEAIAAITAEMRKVAGYMEVQYGIDNPAFLDLKTDRDYMLRTIVPWIFKYALTVPKIGRYNQPLESFLTQYTSNQVLIDIIAQHFFEHTPAFFALSYLKLYLDYHYPLGGTGVVVSKMLELIEAHGGEVRTGVEVTSIDPDGKLLQDAEGNQYTYRSLVWAADLKAMYSAIQTDRIADSGQRKATEARRAALAEARGNDSILTLYVAADLPPDYFRKIASEHFIYTPNLIGESAVGPAPLDGGWENMQRWLGNLFAATSYEVAIPSLRDPSLAPAGKTGLVISMLFDYRVTEMIHDQGWYEDFKQFCESEIIHVLDGSIYPGLEKAVLFRFSASPLTIAWRTGNTEGAIVGWAFTNDPMPAESRLPKIFSAARTTLPDIFQAGQWTYSPAGLPISILTGKLAADQALARIKKTDR